MPQPLQLPEETVVLKNRFGDGPFDDCRPFVNVVLPPGVEIEGVYNAAGPGQRQAVLALRLRAPRGKRSHTVGIRWAPTEKGAAAMIASLARTIDA